MATEIELKLSLPPRAASRVAQHPLLQRLPARTQNLPSTYFDTPELELTTLLVAVRLRRKGRHRLLAVKSAEPGSGGLASRNEWEVIAPRGSDQDKLATLDFAFVDKPALRQRLADVAPRLTPIFTTRIRRTHWEIAYGQSQIELALDRGHIESRGYRSPICELELELLSGNIDDLFALGRELQTALHLHPAVASKAERGYALFLAQSPQPHKALSSPITPAQTPIAAFRAIALGCLEQLQRNEIGIADPEQAEFVHQARIALRRLRTALRLFAPLLPSELMQEFAPRWRDLARIFGQARNRDVWRRETLPALAATIAPDARDCLLAAASRRAARAHRQAGHCIAGIEYSRLILDFSAALFRLPERSTCTLTAFALPRLVKLTAAIRRTVRKTVSPSDLHRLRLRLKRLRYALEFMSPLLDPAMRKPCHTAVATLQEQLGRANDLSVAVQQLPELRRNIPATTYRALQEALQRSVQDEQRKLERELSLWRRKNLPPQPA